MDGGHGGNFQVRVVDRRRPGGETWATNAGSWRGWTASAPPVLFLAITCESVQRQGIFYRSGDHRRADRSRIDGSGVALVRA